MTDDSLRRQLRFSLFLQAFAALMMGGAAVVRLAVLGLDAVTAILLVAFGVIVAAAVWTWRKLASLPASTED